MIAPVLAEVLTHAPCPISLFSGVDFTVAPEQGLNGVCDFSFLCPLNSSLLQHPSLFCGSEE